MTLDEARRHIDDKVIYSTRAGEMEEGVIASVGGTYVFVRYGRQRVATATLPQDLTLMRGGSLREHVRLGMEDAGFGPDLAPGED